MTTISHPPPSHLRRAVELDAVRDVILAEGQEQMATEPIARAIGPLAPRARLEAQLRCCRADEDLEGERVISLELSRIHFENAFDVDLAVQLLHRALELGDDRELRDRLARQLATMGRHVEAGHVLRDGEPQDAGEVFAAWLESGEAYGRGGDADEAVATYRETAMIAPEHPVPFERIAAVAYWRPDVVPPERAADAFLEASKRHPPGSPEQVRDVIRAFEMASSYARSAEAYTRLLEQAGRRHEADEVWRIYGLASGHIADVASRRAQLACRQGAFARALVAALDACIATTKRAESRDATLNDLLEDEAMRAWLAGFTEDVSSFASGLLNAARTRSSMGRAEAFTKLSRRLQGEGRAALLAFASESYASAGNTPRACEAALRACAIAPWLSRAQAQLVAMATDDDISLGDVEAALSHLPTRASVLRLVAERFDAEGNPQMALMWNRRMAELRPGDLGPLETMLDRAVGTGDPTVMSDAVADVLDQPRPWPELCPALSRTLRAIEGRAPSLALEVAGQVLSTVGPCRGELYETVRRVAAAADDGVIELAATLGHAVGDEIDDDGRALVYLEAAELSLAYGDVEAAAVHVSRAAAHAAAAERVRELVGRIRGAIGALDPDEQSDALLCLARAKAWVTEQQDTALAVQAWRELGGLRLDLAEDVIGAEEAYFVACAIEPDLGAYRYASDLVDRLGADEAFATIVDRAVTVEEEGADPAMVARLYVAAAHVAAAAGKEQLAMDTAVSAVRADSSRGDAVALVEKLASGPEGLAALDFVYETLANAALGRYGFRAAHYRAARQLEKLGAAADALRHAIAAFEAVPGVGASYQMLLRLAERAGEPGAAVSSLATVAASLPVDGQVAWLVRAADLARRAASGGDVRLDLLLKAFALRPAVALVEELGSTAAELMAGAADGPHDQQLTRQRLGRAIHEALPKLDGPNAADVAVALGVLAARTLEAPGLAVDSVMRAVQLDRHETDFGPVLECLDAIATDRRAARRLLEQVNELRAKTRRPLAVGLKELTSKLYLTLSDVPPASLAAELASDEPLGSSPPAPAEEEGFWTDEPSVDDGLTPSPTEEAAYAPATAPATAAFAPEAGEDWQGVTMSPAPPPLREEPAQEEEAVVTPRYVGPGTEYEPALGEDEHPSSEAIAGEPSVEGTEYEPAPVSDELPLGEELEYVPAGSESPAPEEPGSVYPLVLTELIDIDPAILSELGEEEAGIDEAEALLTRTDGEVDWSAEAESDARQRGDHAAIAAMLAARARATPEVEQRRLIRLRRAAVLEQRLDRLAEACAELELILAEGGEDPTALRYLADLWNRQKRHARAAKLWLRASHQASGPEEKMRDVVRCCESLVAADRPDIARKLLGAARGLPQSPKLLRLRVLVARKLGDRQEAKAAAAELKALDAAVETPSTPPGDSLPPPAPSDGRGPAPRMSLDAREPTASTPPRDTVTFGTRTAERARPATSPPVSSRRVFRVQGASAEDDSARDPGQVLDECLAQYLSKGPGGPRDAKRVIRRLRAIMDSVDDDARDVHTFLLVESLDAAQGNAAAMLALQQHWEAHGGTPLVTLAVADRLLRRGELRPALQLYRRVLDKDLHDVRTTGKVALDAADIAYRLGDYDTARGHLDKATEHADTQAEALRRSAEWFTADMARFGDGGLGGPAPAPFAALRWEPEPLPWERSRVSTRPPPPAQAAATSPADPARDERSPSPAPAAVPSASPSSPAVAETVPSARPRRPLSAVVRRIPTLPDLAAPREELLYNELIDGSTEAGDKLCAIYGAGPSPRTKDVVAVRRVQVTLRRADPEAMRQLRDAATADRNPAYARAIDHVIAALDPALEPIDPPDLALLSPQPEATRALLLSWLDGSVNEALAIVFESGILRRELSDYELTGADRVPAVASTPVARAFAAISRVLDLGPRLFHRARSSGPLRSQVALVNPLAAILSGHVDHDSPELVYEIGSALAAATPPLALVEGLEERHVRNITAALAAGFGPVEEGSVTEASPEQMRIAEDLWHVVTATNDRRLRRLCEAPSTITFESAVQNARTTRRRAGLLASGDLATAIRQTVSELGLSLPTRLRGAALRELYDQPEVADLYDLALLPQYAEARWRR